MDTFVLLDMDPREILQCVHRFSVYLFEIMKSQKQLKFPSVTECRQGRGLRTKVKI